MDKALDERTIGHNPERLNLLKGGIIYSNKVVPLHPCRHMMDITQTALPATHCRCRSQSGILPPV